MFNKMNIKKAVFVLFALILLFPPKLSYADERDRRNNDRDRRNHEERHYYHYRERPHFGLHVSYIPDDCFTVWSGRARYYYYDGLYYNRIGMDYVIVAPPVGAVVRTIPSDYQPVVINGMTYYVDNETYYVYTRHGYQVVPRPYRVVQTISPPVVVHRVPATSIVRSQEKFGIADVITLSKSGVSDDILVDKIVKTGSQFKLSVEEVEALRQEGVSSGVINFMLTGRYTLGKNQTVVQPPAVEPQAPNTGVPVAAQGSLMSDNEDSFSVNVPNSKGGYTAVTLKRSENGFVGPQGEFYSEFPKISQLKAMYGK